MTEGDIDVRALVDRLVDRASSDTAFKQQLLDDPAAALQALGVTSQGGADVSGRMGLGAMMKNDCEHTCLKTCKVTE